MEFWGIEVKAGQPIKAFPGAGYIIHLSQASLGESKNKAESVPLYVNAGGKKLVLGTLSHQNCPQLSLDLVFDIEFELSHNWKNGSVYFLGYKTCVPEEGDDFDISSDDESSEEEIPLADAENGKAKANAAKKLEAVKQAVKLAESNKKSEDEDSDDSEDEIDSDDEDDSEDESDSAESKEGSSDEEDEETPKKVESSKKRPAEAATPASKKAKSAVSPQKTDGKKGGHTATPHPAKQAGKNSAKTPKSFGGGPGSNKKAKHGGK